MTVEKVRVEALVDASIDKVWQVWITPEHITQWNFASDDWCCPSASVEARQGGRHTARMEAKDGSFGFDFEGTYEVFEEKDRVALRMGDGRLAETTFTPEGGSTRVVTEFDAETENDIAMQRDGWQAILNSFKRHAERV